MRRQASMFPPHDRYAHTMRHRWLAGILTAFLALQGSPAAAAASSTDGLTLFSAYPTVARAALVLDAQGYAAYGEYVYQNAETGEYHYTSPTLQVHITRHQDTDPKVVWHEAQIYSRNGTLFHVWPFNPQKATATAQQTLIAQKHHLVFAINGDFSHLRIGWDATVGLLIRNQSIIFSRTYKKTTTRYPNLDNLAFLPDGSMLAQGRNDATMDDYLSLGAYDLLAFGPVLIHNGIVNSRAFGRYGWERAPRTALGMVSPGHYVAIMVEGRHENSRGWSTTHLAAHMAALGVTEALNLDGGQSATMIFMGKQIIRVGNSKSLTARPRKSAEVVGIGQSKLVWPVATKKK